MSAQTLETQLDPPVSQTAMSCQLMNLPVEIRHLIWAQLLPSLEVIRVTTTWDPNGYHFQLYSAPSPLATLDTLADTINDDFFHDLIPSLSWSSQSLSSLRRYFTTGHSLLTLNRQVHAEVRSILQMNSRILVLNDMMLDNTRMAIDIVRALQFDVFEKHEFFAMLVRCGRSCNQAHQYLISRLMEEAYRFGPGKDLSCVSGQVGIEVGNVSRVLGKDYSVTFRREERLSGMWWIRMIIKPWMFEIGEDELGD